MSKEDTHFCRCLGIPVPQTACLTPFFFVGKVVHGDVPSTEGNAGTETELGHSSTVLVPGGNRVARRRRCQ